MRKTTARIVLVGDFFLSEIARFISLAYTTSKFYEWVGISWITSFTILFVTEMGTAGASRITSGGFSSWWFLYQIPIVIGVVGLGGHILAYLLDTADRFWIFHEQKMPEFRKKLHQIIEAEPTSGPVSERGHVSVVENKNGN